MSDGTRATHRAEAFFVRQRTKRRPLPGELPDASASTGTDSLPQIRHIIVLMMENHSFDNYLGMLGRGDGFRVGEDGTPTAVNLRTDGSPVRASRRDATDQEHDLPTQTWHGSHVQWNAGKNDGFVRSGESLVRELGRSPLPDPAIAMSYWDEEHLPFYYGLANTFPLIDRWFGSCLGPTFPNRRFLIAGTAHGLIDDLPFGMLDYPEAGTIFDRLTANRISWVNYHNVSAFRIAIPRVLGSPGLKFIRAIGLILAQAIPRLREYMIGRIQFTANLYPLGALGAANHLRSLDTFFRDAAEGTLPSVSIVDPDFGRFSEENPQNISHGEGFAAAVITAAMEGKGWPSTLLVWTYDEHGGYFDHVPPPPAVAPDDVEGHSLLNVLGAFDWLLRRFRLWRRLKEANGGAVGNDLLPRTYDRLGFRVPAVIVSPFARPDYVTSRDGRRDAAAGDPMPVYDHTSILKLIERKWNLPSLTRRDAEAEDLLHALDLEGPPAFLAPPVLPKPRVPWEGLG